MFQIGNLKSRVGKARFMNNGQAAKVIAYRNAKDVDIQFEDGTVVLGVQFVCFKNGTIRNPNFKPHVGESLVMHSGQRATVTDYRNANDIDVMFQDGTLVTGVKYANYLKRAVKNPNYNKYVGKKYRMKNDRIATIIRYRNARDLDVRLSNGEVYRSISIRRVQAGCLGVNRFDGLHVGERKVMNNGQEATIVKYRKYGDLDVQFSDGTLVKHRTYNHFKRGSISNTNKVKSA